MLNLKTYNSKLTAENNLREIVLSMDVEVTS